MKIQDKETVLITGCAGFIGFHLSKLLLENGYVVTGVDAITDYYDVGLKKTRLGLLEKFNNFHFEKMSYATSIFGEIFHKPIIRLCFFQQSQES